MSSYKQEKPIHSLPIKLSNNVTIRGKRGIPSSTSKLIRKPYLPRAASVISLRTDRIKNVTSRTNYMKCRKSFSVQDLSPSIREKKHLKRVLFPQMESERYSPPAGQLDRSTAASKERDRKLAMRVYMAFLRNAWVKASRRSAEQETSLSAMTTQVKNTKIQINSLKSLLKSDEQFIRDWIKEIHKLRKTVEILSNERDELRMENHNLETNLEETKDELNQMKVELLNGKNLLQDSQSEAKSLETQLDKERQKIRTLKTELKTVSDKVLDLQKHKPSRNVNRKKSNNS